MASTYANEREAEHDAWIDSRTRDAGALIERFGADGVEWLDRFLEDYVFAGEPLDQVMTESRRLSGLPARPQRRSYADD